MTIWWSKATRLLEFSHSWPQYPPPAWKCQERWNVTHFAWRTDGQTDTFCVTEELSILVVGLWKISPSWVGSNSRPPLLFLAKVHVYEILSSLEMSPSWVGYNSLPQLLFVAKVHVNEILSSWTILPSWVGSNSRPPLLSMLVKSYHYEKFHLHGWVIILSHHYYFWPRSVLMKSYHH